MWLACDPLRLWSQEVWVSKCDNVARVINLTLRFGVKNIFQSALKVQNNLQKQHGEVNKLLSNKTRSTIQSVQSCQQKVKNTIPSILNRTEMVTLGAMFKFRVQRAEMALAATLLPRGRVRSVMARTTLGLARAGSFTSSDTYRKAREIAEWPPHSCRWEDEANAQEWVNSARKGDIPIHSEATASNLSPYLHLPRLLPAHHSPL